MTEVVRIPGTWKTVVDVVFLHGLDGGSHSTWCTDDWPGWLGWLQQDLPEIAVWTVSYGAASSRWRRQSALPITDRATNLLAALENAGVGQRPVCFVVHSMGGLILKEMLLDSAEGGVNQELAHHTHAVAFIATPHNGSQLATVANRFRRVFRTTSSIVDLKRDDAHLRRASNRYRLWANDSHAEHLVFYETTNIKGLRVVDEGSSDPGIIGVRPIPVDANHSRICKPDGRQSLVYGQVRGLLQRVLDNIKSAGATHSPTAPGARADQDSAQRGGPPPLLRVRAEGAFGRNMEIVAFDHDTVAIVARALGLTAAPEGLNHD